MVVEGVEGAEDLWSQISAWYKVELGKDQSLPSWNELFQDNAFSLECSTDDGGRCSFQDPVPAPPISLPTPPAIFLAPCPL